MKPNQCFLVVGDEVANISNPTNKGYEILDCNIAIEQVSDENGERKARLRDNSIKVKLRNLPTAEITEWGLTRGKFLDCAICFFEKDNKQPEVMILKQATCVNLKFNYDRKGEIQSSTEFSLCPKKLIVEGIELDN